MASRSKTPIEKSLIILKNEGAQELTRKSINLAKLKIKHIQRKKLESTYPKLYERYEYLGNNIFQIDAETLNTSQNLITKKDEKVHSMLWFVPYFDHLVYGGIYTIFRFIEQFTIMGAEPTIVIYDNPYMDVEAIRAEITQHFPGLKDCKIIIFNTQKDNINDLPACDIAFATIWMSAYLLLRYNKTSRKYYFIQDYEPLFYEGGSMYALAESTYRFGFSGVVNTPGLLSAITERHGMQGVSFKPSIDGGVYFAPKKKPNNARTKIFFYARPGNPRNAFELCILIIQQLIKQHGDAIEIVTAGADWDEKPFGLKGKITNLGLLKDIVQVAELYRSCDIGCVYMLSKHPSYQPFEFMACGVATVTNRNEDNTWFLKDGENCLLAEPSPKAMAEKINQLIADKKLRDRIVRNGYDAISTDWSWQIKKIWKEIST